ncbi:MAG TPA: SGNH/GDSL hydrolase family protein [Thermodesulfobacteriota bacterium]|nr:SGNH/GDSL hydrolase family protein [Thermodesulfobacteriota bacterium]
MLKILSLGDSYTVGQGVERSESWPMQLALRLQGRNLPVDTPLIIAATSWTTSDLMEVIARSDIGKEYDIVTLLIGVNDQFQGYSEYMYAYGFDKLLTGAIAFAGGRPGRVIVVSIPDYSVTKFGKKHGSNSTVPEINRFNEINKKISMEKGVNYVDITEVSRRAAQDSSLVASDGLHPSARMYEEWVELITPVALSALHREK